jgi:rubrerythrin
MMDDYTAKEVFEMAIQIEENGAAFYRRAAQLRETVSDRRFLEDIAVMEDQHKATFEGMKQQISDLEKTHAGGDRSEKLKRYLKAMADSHGGEGNPDILSFFNGQETMEEIIATAIDFEKSSILFYRGIEEMVPVEYGRDKISGIIEEEKAHVTQLNTFLEKIRGSSAERTGSMG